MAEIEEDTEEITVGSQGQVPKPQSRSKVFLLLLLGLILAGGLMVVGMRTNNKGLDLFKNQPGPTPNVTIAPTLLPTSFPTFTPNLTPMPSPKLTPGPTTTPGPSAGWKIYNNRKYGYSLKYPEKWAYLEVPNKDYSAVEEAVWFSDSAWVATKERSQVVMLIRFLKDDPEKSYRPEGLDNYKKENITIGKSLSGIRITGTSKTSSAKETVTILPISQKGGIVNYIAFTPRYSRGENKEFDEIFDLMLSNFSLSPAVSPMTGPAEGMFCGGLMGVTCPVGFRCQLEGDYPDAAGACVRE